MPRGRPRPLPSRPGRLQSLDPSPAGGEARHAGAVVPTGWLRGPPPPPRVERRFSPGRRGGLNSFKHARGGAVPVRVFSEPRPGSRPGLGGARHSSCGRPPPASDPGPTPGAVGPGRGRRRRCSRRWGVGGRAVGRAGQAGGRVRRVGAQRASEHPGAGDQDGDRMSGGRALFGPARLRAAGPGPTIYPAAGLGRTCAVAGGRGGDPRGGGARRVVGPPGGLTSAPRRRKKAHPFRHGSSTL